MRPCRNCGQVHDPYMACPRRGPTGQGDSLTGRVIADRYRIGDVIGIGSTGAVYAAEHLAFARPAAVKLIHARHAPPDLVSQVFHGDAAAAWGLAHPSLCEVFDLGTLPDTTPFFVMERLDGESLQARIMRERLSLAAGIDMMMQLLSAVVAMHARDLLVRDLRPTNVFLVHRRGCRPLVKLLDLGLGRLSPLDRLQEQWTQVGPQPGGHPHYLSPERIRGEHAVEPASDLFVAGAIFYEALAGERAFNASSWRGILEQVARAEPTPLHERRGDIPLELSQFVSRCLAANPRTRPSTAKEMQDELRSIFEDARKQSVSIYAPPPSIYGGPNPNQTRRPPPGSVPRIAAEPYVDDTETRRASRSAPVPASAPAAHPADELDQTLERVGVGPSAPVGSLASATGEEDETQTTRMSDELKARIDQLMAPAAPPPPSKRPRS